MMRFALLLPIWLVFAVGEPSLLHTCPTHGAGVSASTQPGDGHAGHEVAAAGKQPASDAPARHSGHSCTCIGACTMASAATLPAIATTPLAPVSLREPAKLETRFSVVRRELRHLLPYANGPPSSPGVQRV